FFICCDLAILYGQNNFMKLPFTYGVEMAVHKKMLSHFSAVGMLTNNAATTTAGVLSRLYLLQNGVNICTLFAPEHGMATRGEDGCPQQHGVDAVTKLPIVSLYFEGTSVSPNDLLGLDAVVIDLPDVGARFYTYLWSATHLMEACAVMDIPVFFLDRPNPLGAILDESEGPWLDEQCCSSFIGRWNIPLKHGCTPGELACYFQRTKIPRLRLEVVAMDHFHREVRAGFDYPFLPTSPALKRWQAVHLYPASCLFEGLNINEGRGSATPFEWIGAPWLDASVILQIFPHDAFPSITLKANALTPSWALYEGVHCNGISIDIHKPLVNAVSLGFRLLQCIAEHHHEELMTRPYPTLANPTGNEHLDRLTGVSHFYDNLMKGILPSTNIADDWYEKIKGYMIYQ
ncbi:MAG TPA: DUF1343 domain-containing protein, partial [Saprospiraceae bacterium]|nr:DUF1343 domain-containing protein [Saprospiraceae bacterium]